MHYFQWNIKTYRADTAHLTNEEDLAYRRLIEHYYDTEQPIPTALPPLCRRLRLGLPVVENILREFFTEGENGWVHEYIEGEIEKYHAFIDKQKANGSKGGRRKKPTANPSKPTAKPKKPSAKPTNNKQPITNNQYTKRRTQSAYADADIFPEVKDRALVREWVKVRRAKRLPITEQAIKKFYSEAGKACMTIEQVLTKCSEMGWAGFSASWVLQPQQFGAGQQQRPKNERPWFLVEEKIREKAAELGIEQRKPGWTDGKPDSGEYDFTFFRRVIRAAGIPDEIYEAARKDWYV